MEPLANKWQTLAVQARVGIAVGIVVIAAMMAALAYWAYRPDYQVLFSDMAARDAAAMTAELEKAKTPYQLGDGGNTILVPRDMVYKTRLKLMGKDVPLHGAVGFEVFNNADFGMTEFVQKVNYLRAIQGELTRTILSIDEIQAARVHLAIPEQGLFKKAVTKPKASVTVTMKPGHVLSAEQVSGIQRLVSASVPDIVSADVTLLDQHGVALTRPAGADALESGSGQLDAKRGTEDYLMKKVTQVLDRTFGAGEAIASVDVALNLDQSKVTTEDVLPARNGRGDANSAGMVVRERHTLREGDAVPAGSKGLAGAGSTSSESDYQVGRRVEQVVAATGSIRRMTIAVVVKKPMTDAQLDKLKEVVALAVGFNGQRGDAIVVNSLDRLVTSATAPAARTASSALAPSEADGMAAPAVPQAGRAWVGQVTWTLSLLLGAVTLSGLVYAYRTLRTRRASVGLDPAERGRLLNDVRRWIDEPAKTVSASTVRQ